MTYLCCRSAKARKRLAVPFRAADTPAERSEWSQPDVALLLTHLATYHTGLTEAELHEAVAELLKMGPTAQDDFYGTWLALSRRRIDAGGGALASATRCLPGRTKGYGVMRSASHPMLGCLAQKHPTSSVPGHSGCRQACKHSNGTMQCHDAQHSCAVWEAC